MEAIVLNNTAFIATTAVEDKVMISKEGAMDGAATDGGYTEGTSVDPNLSGGAAVKDPLLSSWPFVIGLSFAVLLISVALGTFLAKRKIKKGIELYED